MVARAGLLSVTKSTHAGRVESAMYQRRVRPLRTVGQLGSCWAELTRMRGETTNRGYCPQCLTELARGECPFPENDECSAPHGDSVEMGYRPYQLEIMARAGTIMRQREGRAWTSNSSPREV